MSKTALIIDDSRAMRLILEREMQSAGWATVLATNGDEGLAKLKAGKFDLVILDGYIPGISSLDLLQQARALPDFSATPFLLIVTESESSQVVRFLALGCRDYLIKPFANGDLVQKARTLAG